MEYLYSANQVADFIVKYSLTEYDDLRYRLSNLKLQNVIFFTDAYFIAKNNLEKSLIKEDYEAWKICPVIPSLYKRFKYLGAGDISLRDIDENAEIQAKDLEIIRPALEYFLPISVYDLVDYSHSSPAWKESSNLESHNRKIDKNKLPSYYFEKILNPEENIRCDYKKIDKLNKYNKIKLKKMDFER